MEATENDLPPSVDFKISGFPTIKFKKAGTREFIDYDGDRSFENLVAFVEENLPKSILTFCSALQVSCRSMMSLSLPCSIYTMQNLC